MTDPLPLQLPPGLYEQEQEIGKTGIVVAVYLVSSQLHGNPLRLRKVLKFCFSTKTKTNISNIIPFYHQQVLL